VAGANSGVTMPNKKTVALAKLTAPRLYQTMPRKRLFRLLDDLRAHPVTWIPGPPGSGKTTLLASYIQTARLPFVWYQLDGGDADPSTFFYYLALAVRGINRRAHRPLPVLTPEYLPDVAGFSRRYFRSLFERLPHGSVLVLDNYQELPSDSPVHAVVGEAINELPDSIRLIAVSRSDPPPALTRHTLSGRLVSMDALQLRLTLEETRGIARLRGTADPATVAVLHERSNGWAAGLVLMLQDVRHGRWLDDDGAGEMSQSAFDYFASEIFDKISEEGQQILLATSRLPQFTAREAELVSGRPAAGKFVDWLYRRRLFVDRRGSATPTYRYHDLFCEFLSVMSGRRHSAAERSALARRAAALLIESDQHEAAALQLAEAADWDTLCALIRRRAPALLAQGRGQTLRDWIALVPQHHDADRSWLRYWHGASLVWIDPRRAQAVLAQSYGEFTAEPDVAGQTLCVSGLLESYYFELADDRRMDPWLRVMEQLLRADPDLPTAEDGVRAYATMVVGLTRRNPDHPLLRSYVEHLIGLLSGPVEVNHKVTAAGQILQHLHFLPDEELLRRVRHIVGADLDDPRVAPITRMLWFCHLGYCLHRFGDFEAALASYAQSLRIGEESGLAQLEPFVRFLRQGALVSTADGKAAELNLVRLETLVTAASPLAIYHGLLWARTGECVRHRRFEQALQYGKDALAVADQSGMTCLCVQSRVKLAQICAQAGLSEEASYWVAQTRHLPAPKSFYYVPVELALMEAYLAWAAGNLARCEELLKEALRHAKTTGRMNNYLDWVGGLAIRSRLYAIALDRGIETEFVREVVRRYRVRPPGQAGANWPWPIKVHAFGKFEVLLDDRPLEFGRKVPRKPLAVLKVIVAAGGSEVPDTALIDALWPELDGDAAYNALTAALARLRVILNDKEAVRQHGGKVALNRATCWVDFWQFEHEIDCVDRADTQSLGNTLALYRGPLLPDEDEGWAIPPRERARARYVQAMARHSEALLRSGELAQTIDCLERALGVDALVEGFYCQLMRCHARMGQSAAVVDVYARMQRILQERLGTAPSASSRALYAELLGDGQATQSPTPSALGSTA